ncbi:MAG: hypothetical protein ACK4NH_08775 [Gemmobacter sp.]|nr:hypothetical protein [Gemmobacter sp.]
MSFVTRLIDALRNGTRFPAQPKGDFFDARLQRMQSRNGTACRATPFRNSRLHSAV